MAPWCDPHRSNGVVEDLEAIEHVGSAGCTDCGDPGAGVGLVDSNIQAADGHVRRGYRDDGSITDGGRRGDRRHRRAVPCQRQARRVHVHRFGVGAGQDLDGAPAIDAIDASLDGAEGIHAVSEYVRRRAFARRRGDHLTGGKGALPVIVHPHGVAHRGRARRGAVVGRAATGVDGANGRQVRPGRGIHVAALDGVDARVVVRTRVAGLLGLPSPQSIVADRSPILESAPAASVRVATGTRVKPSFATAPIFCAVTVNDALATLALAVGVNGTLDPPLSDAETSMVYVPYSAYVCEPSTVYTPGVLVANSVAAVLVLSPQLIVADRSPICESAPAASVSVATCCTAPRLPFGGRERKGPAKLNDALATVVLAVGVNGTLDPPLSDAETSMVYGPYSAYVCEPSTVYTPGVLVATSVAALVVLSPQLIVADRSPICESAPAASVSVATCCTALACPSVAVNVKAPARLNDASATVVLAVPVNGTLDPPLSDAETSMVYAPYSAYVCEPSTVYTPAVPVATNVAALVVLSPQLIVADRSAICESAPAASVSVATCCTALACPSVAVNVKAPAKLNDASATLVLAVGVNGTLDPALV